VIAGSLFSGTGQLDFGLHLAGIEHSWFCEKDEWRRGILAKRWPGVPIFDDVRAVDCSAPSVDLLVGGFPCRGASTAGDRTGLDHPETALWREMARIAGELRPRLILVENVGNLLAVQRGRAWGEVLGDLASLGYVCAWDCLPAAAFGAPHLRDRVFLVAADGERGRLGGEGRAAELGAGAVVDAPRPDGQGALGGREALGRASSVDRTPADSNGHSLREQPEPERGSGSATEFGIAGRSTADPDRQTSHGLHEREQSRPVATDLGHPRRERTDLAGEAGPDWGNYSAAIQRWEETAGSAPEPLLRGVDARSARRVVRSRLSALGDGVQVQAGEFLGRRILEFDREHAMSEPQQTRSAA